MIEYIPGHLKALLELKTQGIISKINQVKYLGCHGGEHIFWLNCGNLCRVDNVLKKIRIC